ncbi:Hpt domain-containing protein [uncultured Shewanella sp.]|uniref:Hpt domain-containing protein n=1 Tax=uncultured Shewanella sp. TaxID=173975 RepID=UPI00262245C5|nr:Hpt domain-containing protein [uncultured Shewanella sp.]
MSRFNDKSFVLPISDESVLDEHILSELVDMVGSASMSKMLQVFLTELRDRLEILNNMVFSTESLNPTEHSNINFNGIALQAHTLKSCAGSFGASVLFEAVKQLEKVAIEQNVGLVSAQLAKVNELGLMTINQLTQRFMNK